MTRLRFPFFANDASAPVPRSWLVNDGPGAWLRVEPEAAPSTTSHRAHEAIQPVKVTLYMKVLLTLLSQPVGLSADEIGAFLDLDAVSITPLLHDGVKKGDIRRTGEERATRSQRTADTVTLTTQGMAVCHQANLPDVE